MNVYRKIIADCGLTAEHQNFNGQLFLMLSALADADDANPTADSYANPYAELLHRFRNYADTPAYKDLAQFVGTRVSGERRY